MKCKFQVIGESEKAPGWKVHRCVRCGLTGHSPYESCNVRGECSAAPLPGEWGEWAGLLLAAIYITPGSYTQLLRKLGLIKTGCGCGDRKDQLNSFGQWVSHQAALVLGFLTKCWQQLFP